MPGSTIDGRPLKQLDGAAKLMCLLHLDTSGYCARCSSDSFGNTKSIRAHRSGTLGASSTWYAGHQVEGQIYIPAVNWLLAALTLACLLIFRSNTAIGNGFGKLLTTGLSLLALR